MVCATNEQMNLMTLKHHDDDFDIAMEEEDDSEDDSSQDETSTPSSSSSSTTTKRPVTQALFLNFTSDLSPQKMNKKKSKPKKQTAYRVNGVNILNRNNLDSKTAIERIQRRRENHNHVERRRRDNINNTIFELSSVVPNAIQPGQKPNKGNILKLSLDYIKDLQAENALLKERLSHYTSSPPLSALGMTSAVDESAPNSPHYVRNHNFTQQQNSVPSSPLHHQEEQTTTNLPPLALPPPQQQLQSVFSTMSVSSNSSPNGSTPNSPYYAYPPSSIYIPQPPQLYNNSHDQVVYHHKQQQQQQLRPLLPATTTITKSHQPPTIQQQQTSFLPALRMSGYEKIYGNVCRY